MLGTALAWSMTIVADKVATDHASLGAHGVVLNVGVGGFGLVWLASRRELRKLAAIRRVWKVWLLSIGFGTLGLGGQLVALQHVFVAVIESLKRAIGLASSVIVGRLLFKEPVTPWKLVAVALMAIGTSVIVFDHNG
jgi:drug/metabolite transporter (DMT)-like permease